MCVMLKKLGRPTVHPPSSLPGRTYVMYQQFFFWTLWWNQKIPHIQMRETHLVPNRLPSKYKWYTFDTSNAFMQIANGIVKKMSHISKLLYEIIQCEAIIFSNNSMQGNYFSEWQMIFFRVIKGAAGGEGERTIKRGKSN